MLENTRKASWRSLELFWSFYESLSLFTVAMAGVAWAQTPSARYNYGNMGLSVTCDFEWSMCGWTQEAVPHDQLDWRRHRGTGGSGWFQIRGDHTPGKDGFGFYLYLDGVDVRRPPPVDPDSIDVPEPDELLAQQTGIASRSIARKPTSGSVHHPSDGLPVGKAVKWPIKPAAVISRPVAAYLYGQSYASHLGSYTSSSNNYPAPSYNTYRPPAARHPTDYGTYGQQPPNMDTNSDVKPYDLPGYGLPANPLGSIAGANGFPYSNTRNVDVQPHAQLIGPRVESPINLTLKFWYHMRGSSVGRLTLYKKVLARPDQIIWEKNGHQSFEWVEAQVQLERGTFQLMFEGTVNPRAPPNGGYVGLDDFLLEREADLPILARSQHMWLTADQRYHINQNHHIQSSLIPHNGVIPVNMLDQHGSLPSSRAVENYRSNFARTGGIELVQSASGLGPVVMPTMQYPPNRSTAPPVTQSNHVISFSRPSVISADPQTQNNWIVSNDGEQLFPKYSTTVTRLVMPSGSNSPPLFASTDSAHMQSSLPTNLGTEVTEGSASENIAEFRADLKKSKQQTAPPQFLPMTKSITSENPVRKHIELELLSGDPTEASAVIQPEETVDKTKLIIVIASCFGVAGFIVLVALLIKRDSCGVYRLVPCLTQAERPVAHRSTIARPANRTPIANARPTPRRAAPPPPVPRRRM